MQRTWEVECTGSSESISADRAASIDPHHVLRRRYFAEAMESAGRYGVRFDRVLGHLAQADPRIRAGAHAGQVIWMGDVVHAVACIDGNERAWSDLIEQHEPFLVHAVEGRLGRPGAILFVRSLLIDLRRSIGTRLPFESPFESPIEKWTGDVLTLHHYTGRQSLRKWLAQRLVARYSREYPWTARKPVLRLVMGDPDPASIEPAAAPTSRKAGIVGDVEGAGGRPRRSAEPIHVGAAVGLADDGRIDASLTLCRGDVTGTTISAD